MTEDDWPLFESLHQNEQVMTFVSDSFSTSEVRERFESRLLPWERCSTHWLALVIIEKETGSKVGVTGLLSDWDWNEQAEIGFLLTPAFQGMGYGAESTQAILRFAFEQCDFHKVSATVTEGNTASERLLLKLGLQHEGKIRDNIRIKGCWYNDLKLGILQKEFHLLN